METVEKAGQKFTALGRELTAEYFFGSNGEPYPTAQEAKRANPQDKIICVKNAEFGGSTELSLSIAIK